ncbi:MAG: YvrJ family protein [Acidaminococcaceae bacterium]|nr:YvrJ family protein [Acidaminococcaceae bacterium]
MKMDVSEVFGFIKDFGFPMVLSWFLLVRMENKLAGLTAVIGELSCNIAALRGDTPKRVG